MKYSKFAIMLVVILIFMLDYRASMYSGNKARAVADLLFALLSVGQAVMDFKSCQERS